MVLLQNPFYSVLSLVGHLLGLAVLFLLLNAEFIAAAQVEVYAGAGHMPHDADPEQFAAILTDFCDSTDAARLTTDHWRPLVSG